MKKPLIVIVGETATGKSKLAFKLARLFNAEIINADSWTVYKNFNIGTAKPTLKEVSLIPHHLIDVADPINGFNAAEFKKLAELAIDDISKRGKLPILVGGTGLYIDSVIYNYSFLPQGSIKERETYNQMTLQEILNLIESSGINIKDIDIRNKRRLIRLLENNGQRPSRKKIKADTLIIGLSLDKEKLRTNITKRVDDMLNRNLEDEVRSLSKQYGWSTEPMKGIGYREFKNYFNGCSTMEETRAKIIKDTLDLAKKQRTWFKRNKSIQWCDNSSNAVDIATTFLNKF